MILKKVYLGTALLLLIIAGTFYYATTTISKKKDRSNIYSKTITLTYPDTSKLKDGDIVFRRGYGMDSIVAANFSNEEKRYSHAGVLVLENDKIYVIHSQESTRKGFDGVVKESLSSYLKEVKIWAVYRYLDVDKKKLLKHMKTALNKNIKFDMDFDLHTDDKMYCSEFIYKSFNAISVKPMIQASKRFMSKQYVTITDLYINKHTVLLAASHKILN